MVHPIPQHWGEDMITKGYDYSPDYAVPPGWVLEERLATHGISHAEFARRCGRSAKLISEIIAGKAPVEPKTAIQFESVLGVNAEIWLGIEASYRLYLEREAETHRAEKSVSWARAFPVSELVARGIIQKPESKSDRVIALLSFFGVASVEAWEKRQQGMGVAYRHSPSFKSDEASLATWLRLGELEAEKIDCANYNETKFKRALRRIRKLTAIAETHSIVKAQRLCKKAGVVFAIIKPLPKTALSGATRWLSPRKALIQLSGRHMRDDQLWFSFFHEAAHILLHSKRKVFIHENKGDRTKADLEADAWAADFLIPWKYWTQFSDRSTFTKKSVRKFAEQLGIAPSIVVGRLQHEGLIAWSMLNHLRVTLEWVEDSAE